MNNSHDQRRPVGQQQQQGSGTSEATREFKPVRLPAVAAAMHAHKPAVRQPVARRLPAFMMDETGGSD